MSSITTHRSVAGHEEIVPDRLYVLGANIPVAGNVSWVDRTHRGHQRVNCYLLRGDSRLTLIDTGVAALREAVLDQLTSLVPPGTPLSVFLTRSEFECTGNLNAIVDTFNVTSIHTGGGTNPFDAFDVVTSFDRNNEPSREILQRGDDVMIGDGLTVLTPVIRLLRTFWGYEASTKTLFTSDLFSHTVSAGEDGPAVIDSVGTVADGADLMRRNVYAKFPWLARARTATLRRGLAELFESREVEILAPTHGCVLKGRDVVREHVQFIDRLLESGEAR